MDPRRISNTDYIAELLNLGNIGQHYINRNYPNVRPVLTSPYGNPRPSYINSYSYQGYQPLSRKKHRIEHISSTLSSTQAIIRDNIISIDALEEFHKNNIQLTHLVLANSAILVPNEYTLPTDIQPCRSLKSLVLDRDSEIWDKNCISMDYIIAKYPNLTHLEFLIRIVSDNYVEYANVLGRAFPEMSMSSLFIRKNKITYYNYKCIYIQNRQIHMATALVVTITEKKPQLTLRIFIKRAENGFYPIFLKLSRYLN
jgi:hypothetical protein